jgi:adenylate kinase
MSRDKAPGAPGMIILGRQGSGKGTQAALISEQYGVVHISTGDMLRKAVADGTALGRRAHAIMEAGDLVPDDVMNGIVDERVNSADVVNAGFLLDGFPRTPGQADALLSFVHDRLQLALNLEVPTEVVTERMLARGRGDDTPESIARRLELYENQTAPLLAWAEERNILSVVDGLGTEEEVFERLRDVIDQAIS